MAKNKAETKKAECPECGARAIDVGGDCYKCPVCGRKF